MFLFGFHPSILIVELCVTRFDQGLYLAPSPDNLLLHFVKCSLPDHLISERKYTHFFHHFVLHILWRLRIHKKMEENIEGTNPCSGCFLFIRFIFVWTSELLVCLCCNKMCLCHLSFIAAVVISSWPSNQDVLCRWWGEGFETIVISDWDWVMAAIFIDLEWS